MDVFLPCFVAEMLAPSFVFGLPAQAATRTFLAVLTWVLIPGTFMIWIAYHVRRERLRGVYRRLRQFETRLGRATSAPSAGSMGRERLVSSVRPSALTGRILLPPCAASSPIPAFRQSLPS